MIVAQDDSAKRAALAGIALFVVGENDFKGRAGRTQPAQLLKHRWIGQRDSAQQTAPRQDHRQPVSDSCEFAGEYVYRFGDADQVVDAATGRLSRGARCGFQQHVGIGVRCKKLPVRIAAGPAVRASPVTASEIEMNAAPMRGQFRSDLGTSANRDSGFGHDAHILCVDHYSRTKDRETPVVTTQDHLNSKTPYGATVAHGGVLFRTWAPNAQHVFVLTGASLTAAQHPGFTPSPNEQMFRMHNNTWGAFVSGLADGAAYRYWIVGTGTTGLKRDPRATELGTDPAYPNCDCIVRSRPFPWHDAGFNAPPFRDLLLYQLHIGVFFAVDAAGNDKRRGVAKFLDLLDRVEYLRELGVNAIQLMPIQEFPSETSRGYNGLDLFSPEMDYQVSDPGELTRYLGKANRFLTQRGLAPLALADLEPGPNQLKCVIDIFHLQGIAVLFDLVFNHAGPGFNEQSMWFFDRQPFGNDNRSLYFTDHEWVGGRVFAYWNQDVRQFLIDNATQCLVDYHIDGIRYDEVSVIDDNGGGRFCQDLTSTAAFIRPRAIAIAEYWQPDRAAAVRPIPSGLGFDAAWGDRLRDGIRGAIRQMAGGANAFVNLQTLAESFGTPAGFDAAWRVVNCVENHDIVYEDREPRIVRLAHNTETRSWFARSRARLAMGLLLVGRGLPMIFMGQEFLEDKPWSDDVKFHSSLFIFWDGLKSDRAMKDHLQFCRDWIWMRRLQPAMRSEFLRVFAQDSIDRVLGVHRWIEGEGRDVIFIANLQESNRFNYRMGFPGAGRWREIFNSEYYDNFPNTGVAGNRGEITAGSVPWQGMPASAEITIPANAFLLFSR